MKTTIWILFGGIGLMSAGCSSAPASKSFDFIDKVTIELPLAKKKNGAELTGKATMVFAKAVPESPETSMQWTCKLSLDAKLVGNAKSFHKRLNENLSKQGLLTSLPGKGELVIRSSIEKLDSEEKQFALRLAEVLGSYRLKEESAGKPQFRNHAGYAFSGFVASTRDLGEIELTLSSDPATRETDLKNVLCSEVQEGVQFKSKPD